MLTALDENLASGEFSFLPPYILALESRDTPCLWETLLHLRFGLERHFANGKYHWLIEKVKHVHFDWQTPKHIIQGGAV